MCDAVSDLAGDLDVKVSAREWNDMNLAIDNGIATALAGYELSGPRGNHRDLTQLLGFYAHEMRNALSTALLAFEALQDRSLPVSASTGRILERSLRRLSHFVMDMLAEVRLDAQKPLRRQSHRDRVPLDDSVD